MKENLSYSTPGIDNPQSSERFETMRAQVIPIQKTCQTETPKLELVLLFWIESILSSVLVDKPKDFLSTSDINKAARQALVRVFHDSFQNVLLFCSSDDICDSMGVRNDMKQKRNPRWRWFWRIYNRRDPSVCFVQQGMPRKEGTCMSIGSHSEQQKVEGGSFD